MRIRHPSRLALALLVLGLLAGLLAAVALAAPDPRPANARPLPLDGALSYFPVQE